MAELPPPPKAAQPFTFRGVARFANGSRIRLACVAGLVAFISSIAICLFAWRAWFPVITQAVAHLPSEAFIASGRLSWPNHESRVLGTNSFLSIAVQTGEDSPPLDRDLNILLGAEALRIRSLPGYRSFRYPAGLAFPLDRTAVAPVWEAWQPVFLLALGWPTMFGLLLTWASLALLYALVPFTMGAILKRDVTFGEAWKLSVAAQFPGAVLLDFFIALYAFNQVTCIYLLLVFAAHFLLSWIYLFVAPFCLPAAPSARNPFNSNPRRKKGRKNPFVRA